MASVGRWSEASLLDLEDDSLSNVSGTSSANNTSNGSVTAKPASVKKSQPRAVVSQRQVLVADAEVVSPVLGLYLPPDETEEEPPASEPVVIRAPRGQGRIASSVPVGLDSGNRRRSKSVQIQIPNGASTSTSSSLSPESYQNHSQLSSSSLSPSRRDADEDALKSPTSIDIYNRRRRGKSPANTSPRSVPYYCSNAVWLSSAANAGTGRPLASSPATYISNGSHATSSLSPPSSSPSSSLSNGRP